MFEAVASRLSFAGGRRDALNVTPAAVSHADQDRSMGLHRRCRCSGAAGGCVEITEEGLELAVPDGGDRELDKLESAACKSSSIAGAGPLQITLLSSFLQIWLLPRIRSFRRKYPDIELRFHTSREGRRFHAQFASSGNSVRPRRLPESAQREVARRLAGAGGQVRI